MIELLVLIVIVGFVCWLVTTLIPMPQPFPQVIIALACLIIFLYILQFFGILHTLPHLRW